MLCEEEKIRSLNGTATFENDDDGDGIIGSSSNPAAHPLIGTSNEESGGKLVNYISSICLIFLFNDYFFGLILFPVFLLNKKHYSVLRCVFV